MRDIFHEELESITADHLKMTALVRDAISTATSALLTSDLALAEKVIADDLAIDFVRRGDDAAFVERREARFAADKNLHAFSAVRDVEQLHQRRALLEKIEKFAQPLHVRREFLDFEQVAFAGNDVAFIGLVHRFVACRERCGHQALQVTAQAQQVGLDALADMVEIVAGKILIEVVGRDDEFRG